MSSSLVDAYRCREQGTTLIDVVVGVALFLVVFVGFFGVFRLAISFVSGTKAQTGALALANEQMEFLRSLPYDAVGTVGGIPAGNIQQIDEIVFNDVAYTRRTFVQYVDAPEDGLDIDDENAITADYKIAKIEVTWTLQQGLRSFSLISNIVPNGIESLADGGTLSVQVFDALGAPVSGASVHISNDTLSPAVDITALTNHLGRVSFPGTPPGPDYEISVTKSGYSAAQTYPATPTNPNPDPGHLSVLDKQTTTQSFAIDKTGSLTIRTFSPLADETVEETFANGSGLSVQENVAVDEGSLSLLETTDGFAADGFARSVVVEPETLAQWEELSWTATVPAGTDLSLQLYAPDSQGEPILISDTELSGNGAGFSVSPIDLSTLASVGYTKLVVSMQLSTSDASTTPLLHDWEFSFTTGPLPLSDIEFSLAGSKTIGTDGTGNPLLKYREPFTTGSTAMVLIESLEWDTYSLSLAGDAGYDIEESCGPLPLSLLPDTQHAVDLFLVPHASNSLRVTVTGTGDATVSGASVRLYRNTYDKTNVTSSCGQAFFTPLVSGSVETSNPYGIEVSAAGYQTVTLTDVDVVGSAAIRIPLTVQ